MPKTNKRKGPGAPAAQSKGADWSQATLPKPAPATPGGPNRLARKEEARRQREALQRKMLRRKAYRVVGMVVAVILVAGLVTGGVLFAKNRSKTHTKGIIQAAGCGAVTTSPVYPGAADLDRTHIGAQGAVRTPPSLTTYPTVPPASGPHDPTPLSAGVNNSPPDIYKAIHSLEHGAVIIWYAPTASTTAVAALNDFYGKSINNDHVIVAPYSYPDQGAAAQLPAGKQMVLVAWHHVEQCARANLAAAQMFVGSYRLTTGIASIPPTYKGDAPEPGRAI